MGVRSTSLGYMFGMEKSTEINRDQQKSTESRTGEAARRTYSYLVAAESIVFQGKNGFLFCFFEGSSFLEKEEKN